jgi:hypothetical protein
MSAAQGTVTTSGQRSWALVHSEIALVPQIAHRTALTFRKSSAPAHRAFATAPNLRAIHCDRDDVLLGERPEGELDAVVQLVQ